MMRENLDFFSNYHLETMASSHSDGPFVQIEPFKGPLVSEQEIVFIFICSFERVLNTIISSDISNLISLYVEPSKRLGWINKAIQMTLWRVHDGVTITSRDKGYCTVLCGDGESLGRSQYTKYEVVFRINKIGNFNGLHIGYIFGSIQDVDFEWGLGVELNKKNSVGIGIRWNKFYLYDECYSYKKLKCDSDDRPSTFPERGQYWRISWDLVRNEMKISMLNQQETDWIPMIHYVMKKNHRDVIPAFSLRHKGDSITLLSE